MEKASILVVAVAPDTYDHIAPLLERRSFEVDRITDPAAALDLLEAVCFDAVIVGHSPNGVSLRDFVDRVRSSASALASLAVLAPVDRLPEIEALRDSGVDLVIPQEEAARSLQTLLSAILGVAPRTALRVAVKLEVSVEHTDTRDRFMTQTEDVSATGMLVHSRRIYPLGSRARFEMILPGESKPVKGDAEITRNTEPGIDRVQGVGCRFLALVGDGETRLLSHLDRLAARPSIQQ